MTKSARQMDNEMMLKIAQDGALSWMDQLIASQEAGVRTLKAQRASFVDACKNTDPKSFSTPVNVLSWFINDVNNMRMQGRLDLVVNHASAIAMATANNAK